MNLKATMEKIDTAKKANCGMDSQPIRGFTELNKDQTAVATKAGASCIYNSMVSMNVGKDYENTIHATGGTIVRK